MSRFQKKPKEKLETKIRNLVKNKEIKKIGTSIKVRNKVLFMYSATSIEYTATRYFSTRKDDLVEETFTVTIPLTHENLNVLSANPINPPIGAKKLLTCFVI